MSIIRLSSQDALSAAFMISSYAPGDNSVVLQSLSDGTPGVTRWDDFETSELELLRDGLRRRTSAEGSRLSNEIKAAIEGRSVLT